MTMGEYDPCAHPIVAHEKISLELVRLSCPSDKGNFLGNYVPLLEKQKKKLETMPKD